MGNLKITMLEYYRFIFLYIFLFIWTFRKYKLFNIVENQNLWLSKEGRGNQAGSRERGILEVVCISTFLIIMIISHVPKLTKLYNLNAHNLLYVIYT